MVPVADLMKNVFSVIVSLALASSIGFIVDPAQACQRSTPISLDEICMKADAIVRATAVKYVKPPVGEIRELNTPGNVEIQFDITQVIKGQDIPKTITLNGYLTNFDDFNDRPVPYDFVRPGGRHGNCVAYEYKQGAEFLLFLKNVEGKLTPYWDALSPVNEQLRSSEDAWVIWVQRHLRELEKKKSDVKRGQKKKHN